MYVVMRSALIRGPVVRYSVTPQATDLTVYLA
jgi:hypothetical protein